MAHNLTFAQSAVMAGLKVVPIKTLPDGSLDLVDLKAKAEQHKDNLAAFMVTYLMYAGRRFCLTLSLDHIPLYFRCLRGRCSRRASSSVFTLSIL